MRVVCAAGGTSRPSPLDSSVGAHVGVRSRSTGMVVHSSCNCCPVTRVRLSESRSRLSSRCVCRIRPLLAITFAAHQTNEMGWHRADGSYGDEPIRARHGRPRGFRISNSWWSTSTTTARVGRVCPSPRRWRWGHQPDRRQRCSSSVSERKNALDVWRREWRFNSVVSHTS